MADTELCDDGSEYVTGHLGAPFLQCVQVFLHTLYTPRARGEFQSELDELRIEWDTVNAEPAAKPRKTVEDGAIADIVSTSI